MPLITACKEDVPEGKVALDTSHIRFSYKPEGNSMIADVCALECPPTAVRVAFRASDDERAPKLHYKLKIPWQYLIGSFSRRGSLYNSKVMLLFAHEKVVTNEPVYVPPLPNILQWGMICFGGHLNLEADRMNGRPPHEQLVYTLNHFWMSPFAIGAWPGRKCVPNTFRKPDRSRWASLTCIFEDWEAHDRQGLKIRWKRFYYRGKSVRTINDALSYAWNA